MKTLTDVLLAGFQVKIGLVPGFIKDGDINEAPGVMVRVYRDHMDYQVFLTEEMLKLCREPPDELVVRHVVDAAQWLEEKLKCLTPNSGNWVNSAFTEANSRRNRSLSSGR